MALLPLPRGHQAEPLATAALVSTKLARPQSAAALLPRPRLLSRLDAATARRLTVVAAPAGYGKTTLLSQWGAATCGRRLAWLTLEEADDDPARFWAYVIAALQRVQGGLGEHVLPLLHAAHPPAKEALLTALVHALATLEDEVVLVLDDYDLITAAAVHRTMAALLSHLPAQLHVVLACRAVPPCPWRAGAPTGIWPSWASPTCALPPRRRPSSWPGGASDAPTRT